MGNFVGGGTGAHTDLFWSRKHKEHKIHKAELGYIPDWHTLSRQVELVNDPWEGQCINGRWLGSTGFVSVL